MKLPNAIQTYFDAERSNADGEAPMDAFAPDAVVRDEGETYIGRAAIEGGVVTDTEWEQARVKIDDVLSGAFPEELLSSNLSELRKQYAQTKSNAESLATRLGPRHPQYISAMQSLETITNEISAELRRIVDDPVAHKDYLMRSSMIQSLRDLEEVA